MKIKINILIILSLLTCSCLNNNKKENTDNNSKNNITQNIGIFSSEAKKDINNTIIRFKKNDKIISRYEFITLLNEKDFRTIVNKTIADLEQNNNMNGYQLKMPIINFSTKDEAFYIVATASNFNNTQSKEFYNYFFNCEELSITNKTNPNYENHVISFIGDDLEEADLKLSQKLKNGAVAFRGGKSNSPEKNKVMISPCPFSQQDDKSLIHIYSYAKKLYNDNLEQRIQNFWQLIGKVSNKMFDGTKLKDNYGADSNEQGLFLNTHGHGIAYLHFRIELTPSYYSNEIKFLTTNKESIDYYNKIFNK